MYYYYFLYNFVLTVGYFFNAVSRTFLYPRDPACAVSLVEIVA